jgi:6-phospho-beta-glucosidase
VHEYKGTDAMPLVSEAWERRKDDPELTGALRRQLRIAAEMDAIPADYFQYYYCQDEVLAELQAKPTTRAEDILGWSSGYWEHYAEQAQRDDPQLDPKFSRGGIHELELAIDAMDAVFNEKDEVLTVNVPNAGGALPGFDDTLVVELLGRCGGPGGWIEPLPAPAPLPAHVRGLVHELGEYQALAAEAAWSGTRLDAIRALAAHPLMVDLDRTERVYDELAEAHREHLPERLLPA